MELNIRTQGVSLTPKIEEHVRAQLQAALRSYADRVTAVDVYLKDVNGPKGGDDKNVVIRTRLRGRSQVAVTELRSDLFSAIGAAARRTKRWVKRAIHKQQRFERRALRQSAYTINAYAEATSS